MKSITDFDSLHESMVKCKKGVSWKPSVKSFVLNSEENLLRMERQLKEGSWKNGKPKPVLITYPKRREALSIPLKDRIYQRSINDNSLYPQMTRSFIYANCACQTGKGTDFARKLIKKYLWNYFCSYGSDGWIVQIDIHGYYLNMRHKDVEHQIYCNTDPDTTKMSCGVLRDQYAGETGYNPGSQMVQIAGISLLDPVDHYIKEQLHVRYYIRYMDDFWMLLPTKEQAEEVYRKTIEQLQTYALEINEKKSHVMPLRKGFLFLGFQYHMTDTGKVIMTLNPDSVKHERRTLVRMVNKAQRGELDEKKIDEHHASWENNADKGNSYKMKQRTNKHLKNLRKGEENGSKKNVSDTCRSGRGRKPQSNRSSTEREDRRAEGNNAVRCNDVRNLPSGRNRRRGGYRECTES